MNPSATAAAPRAAHDAPDASPRVPTTYLPNTEYLRDLGLPTSAPPTTSYYLLPSVAEDAVSISPSKQR